MTEVHDCSFLTCLQKLFAPGAATSFHFSTAKIKPTVGGDIDEFDLLCKADVVIVNRSIVPGCPPIRPGLWHCLHVTF
jgi:hypothetical protein